jgi:hypothetical protein
MTTPAPVPVKRRGFPWWIYGLAFVLIVAFMISPIIPVSISGSIAAQHGCVVHEGFVNPCIVDGKDIGQDLYAMGMMGWFFLATAPLGLGALLIWLIGMIVHRLLWGRARKREAAVS